MQKDLTKGNEAKAILFFAMPMILGNLFQQFYNIADTVIVGQFIGPDALAAVGASYTLMVFLTSVILGLCMGSGIVFSLAFGASRYDELQKSFFHAFVFIALVSVAINILSFVLLEPILVFLHIPQSINGMTRDYLQVIFAGIFFVFLYNYFAAALRSMGNSVTPLIFLMISAGINIGLDILFVVPLGMGVVGAAAATVIAQAFSAVAILIYCVVKVPLLRISRRMICWDRNVLKKIIHNSVLTSIQQSIMNFGILMVQGLVNTFGVTAMAGFAAAVKIDSFAYMPVQDFGNAFSTYIAQNKGAGDKARIRKGTRAAFLMSTVFCVAISSVVILFARQLMTCFISPLETGVIEVGIQYLTIVASFYCLIGYLFLFYGFYRGLALPEISVVLTVISLGLRVLLAYVLAAIPEIGLPGIWWAIPIGWLAADLTGYIYYRKKQKTILTGL